MRRTLTALGVAVLAASLLMAGAPAQAGSYSWDDPADDPGTLAQATLDITKVTLDFNGAVFNVTMDIKQLGEPAPFGTGQYFGVEFLYGENRYILRLTQDRLLGDAFSFQVESGQSQVSPITCRTCKYQLDFEASKVRFQIGLESLKSALRKFAPGQSIEGLLAYTGAAYSEPSGTFGTFLWGGSTPGDSAPAPDPASFTF